MPGDTEQTFQEIERAPARQDAQTAHAQRVAAWKAQWGFVDDRVLEERPTNAPPTTWPKGSRDDSEIGYGHKKPEKVELAAPVQAKVATPGLADSIAEFEHRRARLRAKFAIDRSAAIDHVTGQAYSKTRRAQLEALTQGEDGADPYYLASQYGMRTARDDKASLRAGLRIEHEQSAIYMRDNPGTTLKMFQELFKQKFPARSLDNVHFVNNPNVLDKLGLFLGPDAVPPPDTRRIDPVAPGIYALDCPPPPAAEGYYEKSGRPAFESLLQSMGTTPSSYQGFRALHDGEGEVPLSTTPLGNADAANAIRGSAPVRALKDLPDSHPMAQIAHTTAALLQALPGAPAVKGGTKFDEATERALVDAGRLAKAIEKDRVTFEDLKTTKQNPQRRKELQSAIATQGNRLAGLHADLMPKVRDRLAEMQAQAARIGAPPPGSDLETKLATINTGLAAAQSLLGAGKPTEANQKLTAVAKPLREASAANHEALTASYEADPLVQSALENIGKISAGMEALVDDAARLTRLFDLLMDELYVLLARSRPYDKRDIDNVIAGALEKRAPSIKGLKNVKPKTFLVSSGMDALTTGAVAAMKNHGQDKVTLNDKDDANTNYFEVAEVLKHKDAIADVGDVIMATLNPSTPTRRGDDPTPEQVDKILTSVRAKLADKAKSAGRRKPAPVSLVLDVTIETSPGGAPGTSELDRLIRELSKPIDEGLLSLVLCKSYQKYASLGSAKLMAGNVTVLGTDAAFEKGADFAAKSDDALDFRNNDESQLMAHLVAAGSDHELPMVKRASDNAKFVGAACLGDPTRQVYNEGLPFVMFTPRDEKNVKEAMFKLGVENRDSFGFQNSSCLDVPGQGLRINTGQDPENALIEKFYAVGHLLLDGSVAGLKLNAVNDLLTAKQAAAAATAASLLASPPDRTEDAKADTRAAPVLARRMTLQAALAGDDVLAKQKALDEVAPLLPYYTAAVPRPAARVELENIKSIEASCHMLAAKVMALQPGDEAALAAQIKQLIDRGLDGVSPEMQGKLIAEWTRLAWKSARPDTVGLVDATAAAASKLPYKEDRATLILDGLPSSAVGRLVPDERNKLLDATLKGLDIRSKLNIAETLIEQNDLFKVETILDRLERPVGDLVKFGKGDAGRQESLTAKLDGDEAPDAMTPEERQAIGDLYQSLRDRLAAARPALAVWAPVQDDTIEKRCIAYERILDSVDPDKPAEVKRLDQFRASMLRLRDGLDPKTDALDVDRIDKATDVGRRDKLFARKRIDAAATKLVPSLRTLIDGADAVVEAANQKKLGLGDKLRTLATLLRQNETNVDGFLTEHSGTTKGREQYDTVHETLTVGEKDVGKQLLEVAKDDKDFSDYLTRLMTVHEAALRQKLTQGYESKLPLTDRIKSVVATIQQKSMLLKATLLKLEEALRAPEADTAGPLAKQTIDALRTHRKYDEVKVLVESQLLPLVSSLPNWPG